MKHASARVLSAFICLLAALSCSHRDTRIRASGTIEAREVRTSSKAGGEIVELPGAEGDTVKAGSVLARIDHSALDIQLSQAEAGVALATANLNLLLKGARAEDISQAQDAIREAGENQKTAEDDLKRLTDLFANGSATQKQLDDARARVTVAHSQYNTAQQILKKLEGLARPEEVQAATARLDQARDGVRLLSKSIEDCTITSPADGIITQRLVEKGELVAPGAPVFIVSDPGTVNLTIYVSESDLGRIAVGQKAEVSIDSYPGRTFAAKVVFISPEAEFTPKNVQTRDERAKLVYGVKLEIPNPDGILKSGMPADASLAPLAPPKGG